MRRAYRWLLSSPDPNYKSYFRDSYDAFATASDTLLKRLRQDCLSGKYQPSNASKVYLPKPSGTLRPITLISTEDQIVYQSIINVVAHELYRRTKSRYLKRIFANLYAGKSAKFFYRRWQDGYREFGTRIRRLHKDGFVYVANFDLTAFYDSIDHHVIGSFLKTLNISDDVISFLLECLERWTSSTWYGSPANIYHHHGIPQGPLSSGALSELVLEHLDISGEKGRKTHYIRYVDDIKIFAKTELELRKKLIGLDLAAKEIGLFPQSSKINIRKVDDPEKEIKIVSRPHDDDLLASFDEKLLRAKILELSRRGRVRPENSSRFRYLLAQCTPHRVVSLRLLKVLEHHPEFSSVVGRYLSRAAKISDGVASEILSMLGGPELYHVVHADLLNSTTGRVSDGLKAQIGLFCRNRLLNPGKGLLRPQPTYRDALVGSALEAGCLSYQQLEKIRDSEDDWWVRKRLAARLTGGQFGAASYREYVNSELRHSDSEVCVMAASRVAVGLVSLEKPYGAAQERAKQVLKAAKVIRSAGAPPTLINPILSYVLKRPANTYDWKKFFGTRHRDVEEIAIFLKKSSETDVDALILRLDSFADAITEILFAKLLPGSTMPGYGSALDNPTLKSTLPVAMSAFRDLRTLRSKSITAHPRQKHGGKTVRLKHSDFYGIRPQIVAAIAEIESKITP